MSPGNYLLTTELLRHLECQFGVDEGANNSPVKPEVAPLNRYPEFLQWLMQVTYWNLGHPELDPLLPSFKLTRFKPMDLNQQFSTKQRWKQMHGLLTAPPDCLKEFLVQDTDHKRFSAPCVKYLVSPATENKLVKPYLEYEVRKFFSLGREASELRAFESTVDQLLALLRLKHEELEARHALIQFYNTQIYEIDKEFFAIQTRQRTLNQELKPVLSRLQRFRIDMGMLTSVGLGFDGGEA